MLDFGGLDARGGVGTGDEPPSVQYWLVAASGVLDAEKAEKLSGEAAGVPTGVPKGVPKGVPTGVPAAARLAGGGLVAWVAGLITDRFG